MTDILEGIPEDSVSVGQLTDIDLSGIPDDSSGASGSGQRQGIDLSGIPDVSPVKEQALEAIKLTEDFDQAREAEAQALAAKHGFSLPLVREELDRVKKLDSYQAAEAMLGESDALSIFMSDPERAALGINDMPKLSGAEKIWNSIKNSQTGRLTGENFNRYSNLVDNSSFLLDVAGDLAAGRPARNQARLDAILSDRGSKNEDTNILQDLAIATGGQLPIVGEVLKERVVKGQTLGMATGTAAAVTPGAQITVPAAYAGGVVVGGTSAAIETAYRVEAAAALPELLNITDVNGQKIDPQIAGVGALAIGAINAGLETVGGNALLNAIPGGRALMTGTLTRAVKSALQDQATVSALAKALKVGGKAVALEGGTEGAQEVVNILSEHVAKRFSEGADGTFFTSFDWGGAVKRVWESAYQGGLAGLGFSAPHITAQATSTAMNTIAAGDLRERVVATGEALNDSTLKVAAPERMKEFLNIAGMGEEVYLDGAALYQMGPEAAGALAGKLGVDSERMQEAVVAGQDIRISTADLYANFTTEEIAAIAEDLKPAPGAMTSRAAKAQDIPEIINRLSDLADDSMDFQRAKGELRDQFKQAFIDRGFDPGAGADQYAGHIADLWERFALGMEMRGGRDAAELLRSTDAKGHVDHVAEAMVRKYEAEYGGYEETPSLGIQKPPVLVKESDTVDAPQSDQGRRTIDFSETGVANLSDDDQTRLNFILKQMDEGVVGQRFQKDDGEWDGFKSTNADWLKKDGGFPELHKAGKAKIKAVIEKAQSGKNLTWNQKNLLLEVMRAAYQSFAGDREQSAAEEIVDLAEKHGLDLHGTVGIPAGSINEGEKVLILDRQGLPDILTSKGFDDQGQVVLQDGVVIKADPWDTVEVIGTPRQMDQAFFQSAWHGSPHRFDKFSTAAIGTGEGNQAYGYGLYFASVKDVAEHYRENLSGGVREIFDATPSKDPAGYAAGILYASGESKDALEAIQASPEMFGLKMTGDELLKAGRERLAEINKRGQLYKVELAPQEDEYLFWDKPLSEQSEKVKAALENVPRDVLLSIESSGGDGAALYRKLGKSIGNKGIMKHMMQLVNDGKIKLTGSGEQKASEYLHSLGIRGIKYLDGSSRGEGDGNYNYVIFSDDDVSITGTFYQGPQGAMQQRGTDYFIRLFATSDLSTLLHESAHVFLAEIERVIESGTASESLQKDYATITDWAANQTDRESTAWADTLAAAGGDELLAESSYRQELFARAFEAYLVDGKAPDVELEGAFNRFRRWLTTVYQSVAGVIGASGMQFELSPEITGVFDNLLRVQSDIDQAAGLYEMTAMSERDMDMFGVAKEDRAYMRRLVEQAKVKGESALHRARSKGKRALKQAWREQFTAEVKVDPLQNLIVKLKAGGGLDLNAVRDLYGDDVAKTFPRNILWDGGAIDLESISYEEGYANPRDMVDAILSWRAPEEIIREKMKAAEAEHDAQFNAEDFIVGTAEYADYLEIKHRYIARGVVGAPSGKNPKVIARQLFRKMAVERVRSMPVRDAMRVDLFLQAMRRANADERRAVMRGDWGEASKASERARLNYEYALESANIKKLVADLEKRGKRLSAKGRKLQRGAKADISQEYYLAISKLLARYGIAPPTVDIADAPTLETLLAQPDDTILSMGAVFSDWLVKENDSRPLKSLSAAEIEEITDLLKYLEGTGRLLINDRMFSAQIDLADLRQEVIANLETLKDRGVLPEKHWLRKLSDQKAKFLAETKIILQLLRELDGYEYLKGTPGPLERLFYDKLEASRRQKLDLKKQWAIATKQALAQLRTSAATFGKAENLAPSIPVPDWMAADGRTWDFEAIVAVAMNMGNEVNRQRVIDGYKLGPADLDILTAKLTSADWKAIQQIGNAISEFWPLLSGVYERMNFFTPGKVEPTPFTSPAGDELAGWYYPLQYDPISIKASQREEQNLVLNETQSAFLPSSVAKGSLKSRQESAGGMPPKLKLSVLNRHVEWAAQYISHAEIIADMNRLLTSPRSQDMRETLRRKLGDETYKAIVSIMRSIARPGGAEQPTVMESLAYRSMNMAAVYSMNLNTMGAVQQLTAIGNYAIAEGIAQGSGAVAGLATWVNGAARFIANPSAALETMRRLSPVMGERIDDNLLKRRGYESSNEAIGDITYGRGQAKRTILLAHDISTRAATVLYAAFDSFISIPGWYGSYLDRLRRGMNPQEAADQATKVFASYSPLPGEMDKTVLQNRRGINIMFTFMSGWASKYYSHSSNLYRALKAGKIGPAQFMSHFVMERVLPVLVARALAQLVYGGGDDDDKSIAESALDFGIDLAVFSFTGIPLAKDIMNLVGNAVRSVVSGDKKKMTRNPFQLPSGMIIDLTVKTGGALYKLAEDFDDEKKQQKAIIALSEIMAFGLKVPNIGKRIDDTWEGIRQAQEEDDTAEQGIAHILLRPDPKKKER